MIHANGFHTGRPPGSCASGSCDGSALLDDSDGSGEASQRHGSRGTTRDRLPISPICENGPLDVSYPDPTAPVRAQLGRQRGCSGPRRYRPASRSGPPRLMLSNMPTTRYLELP